MNKGDRLERLRRLGRCLCDAQHEHETAFSEPAQLSLDTRASFAELEQRLAAALERLQGTIAYVENDNTDPPEMGRPAYLSHDARICPYSDCRGVIEITATRCRYCFRII